jgi:tetratricopeptide (TPR) repeat protein
MSGHMKSDRKTADVADIAALIREGEAEIRGGQFGRAEQLLARAVKREPDSARALHLLGVALHEQGALDRAIACYRKSLRLDPQMVEAHRDLAVAHAGMGRHGEALASYREALRIDASDEEASRGVAEALWALGHFSEARRVFQRLLWLKLKRGLRRVLRIPAARERAASASLVAQAEAALKAGRLSEALRCAQLASEADPASAPVRAMLAEASGMLGDVKAAELHSRAALRLEPENVRALLNLGSALKDQDRIDEALAAYERALRLAPDDAELCAARGTLSLEGYGRLDEALVWYRRARELRPQDARAEILEAHALLLYGRYAEGWQRFESRKRSVFNAELHAQVRLPEWQGDSLEGRSIVLYSEQGLGDEIMYAACIGEVLRRARACHILANERLAGLFARSFPGAHVVAWRKGGEKQKRAEVPQADVCCALGSLPRYLRNSTQDFPDHRGYLVADPGRVLRWRERLQGLGATTCIGISWRGGFPWTGAVRRSLELGRLAAILQIPGIAWVSMQYTDCAAEIERFTEVTGVRVHHWQDAVGDFEAHAALAAALDHRVSVCTTFAHLCGALGKPVSILVPYAPGWRYGIEGATMPWYPSARLYRQLSPGAWDVPIQALAADLRKFVNARASPGAV